MVDDAELERQMREGLERRALEVDRDAPVVARATGAVRRRHRGALAIGFAAASVAAIGVVAAVSSTPPETEEPGAVVADPAPGEWRTEYWRDIQVDVPSDWAWGVTPRGEAGVLTFCGGVFDGPYVGRPIAQSDLCTNFGSTPPPPTDPYVWLDADLPAGSVDLGEGWVRETVEVGESTVTVAFDDADLRDRVIGSVREQTLCAARIPEVPAPRREWTVEGTGRFRDARVCAYESGGGGFRLTYASPLQEEALDDTYAALDDAPDSNRRCKATSEIVVVSAVYEDPYAPDRDLWLDHDLVFDMDCGHAAVGESLLAPRRGTAITEESVKPWADEALRYIVCWGGPQWAHKYFLQGWC